MVTDHTFLFQYISFYCKFHITLIMQGPPLTLFPSYHNHLSGTIALATCQREPAPHCIHQHLLLNLPPVAGPCHRISCAPATHHQLVILPARINLNRTIPSQSSTTSVNANRAIHAPILLEGGLPTLSYSSCGTSARVPGLSATVDNLIDHAMLFSRKDALEHH